MKKVRKGSEDDIDLAVNPYMIRKIKYKQFMKKNTMENTGNKSSAKKWLNISKFLFLILDLIKYITEWKQDPFLV